MFEGLLQPVHLLVILAIALLMFGPQKLPQLGKDLGEAIRGFREGLHAVGDKTIEESGVSQKPLPPQRQGDETPRPAADEPQT